MEFRFITTADPLYQQELALRFELLRKPLNMPQGSEAFPFEEESLHLVAVEGGRVVGCVLFKPEGNSGRIFQMAVAKDFQGRGAGTAMSL
ncbi:MAG: GNAT family N-acetyltransferase [bacterium]